MLGRRSFLGMLGLAPTMAPAMARSIGESAVNQHYIGNVITAASPEYTNKLIGEKEYLLKEIGEFKQYLADMLQDEEATLQRMIAENTRQMMSYYQPQIDWDIRSMKSISDVGKIHMQAVRTSKRELEERKKGYLERITSMTQQLMGLK